MLPSKLPTPRPEPAGDRLSWVSAYLAVGANHPRWTIALLLLLTLIAGSRLGDLRLHLSAQQMMLEDAVEQGHYRAFRETFGEREGLLLFLHDPQLLTRPRLAAIQGALQAIEALPWVSGTTSLFNLKRIWVDARDQVHADPYLERYPADAAERDAWLRETLRNPLVRDYLLSGDGHSMAVSVHLEQAANDDKADQRLVAAVDAILAPLEEQLELAFQIGSPSIRQAVSRKILADLQLLLPAALGLLLLILALTLRRREGVFIPLATAVMSVVWTLGLLAHLQIPLNVLTAIVPALLIMVGSTEDIHVLAEYFAGRAATRSHAAAMDRMVRRMGLAVLLTFVTTALGFLSIAANPVQLLREFAVVASLGLGFNFLITGLLIPAWLQLAGTRRTKQTFRPTQPLFDSLVVGISVGAIRHRWALLGLLGLLSAALLTGASRLRVDNDPLSYFDPQEPVVQRFDHFQQQLTGGHAFSIVLDARIEGTFTHVRYLEEIARLQRYIEESGHFRKSLSFADIIAMVNQIMDGPPGAAPYLPVYDDLVQEYLLFLDRADIEEYVSADYSQVRILVRHDIASFRDLQQAIDGLQNHLDDTLPKGITARITGEEILTGRAAEALAQGQAWSLVLVLAMIWVLISLVFLDPRAGLIAIAPHLFPIILLFGVMGWSGIPLDAGTAMVAAIALGICVDDTTHFMVRYHKQCRRHEDPLGALETTVEEEATPLVSTSLALAVGFALLGLSSFPPVTHFGLLSAMVVLAALLSTFTVTPMLLVSVRLISVWDLLALPLQRRVQQDCRLFRGLGPWQIKKLLLLAEVRELGAGDTLFHAGRPGASLAVVLDGALELWGADEGALRAQGQCGPGDTLGEVALLGTGVCRQSAVALLPSRVLILRWESIRRVVSRYPRIGASLFHNLSNILGEAIRRREPT
jgi:predicted RND superfamily exporter protein